MSKLYCSRLVILWFQFFVKRLALISCLVFIFCELVYNQEFELVKIPINDLIILTQQGEINDISYSGNGKIAIQLTIKKQEQIYILEKGKQEAQKLQLPGSQTHPFLSVTTGQYLTFVNSDKNGAGNIFLLDLNSGNLLQITNTPDIEDNPVVDDNASIVAFTVATDQKTLKKGEVNINTYTIASKELKQITTKETNDKVGISGDGKSLIFIATNLETARKTVNKYDINTANIEKLANSTNQEFDLPGLNYDGTKAFYLNETEGGPKAIIHDIALKAKKGTKIIEGTFPCLGMNDSTITYFLTDEGYINVQNENPYTKKVVNKGFFLKSVNTMKEEPFNDQNKAFLKLLLMEDGLISGMDLANDGTIALIYDDAAYVFSGGKDQGVKITDEEEEVLSIALSTDGHKVVYSSVLNDVADVFYIDRVAKKKINVSANNNGMDVLPSMDKTGDIISYTSDRDGDLNIYAGNMKTRETNQITSSLEDETDSHVLPDGSAVVYRLESKSRHMVCMKQLGASAPENVLLQSPSQKFKQLNVSQEKLVFVKEAASSQFIDYLLLKEGKSKSLSPIKGLNMLPQCSTGNFVAWVCINEDKSSDVVVCNSENYSKDYKVACTLGMYFDKESNQALYKLSPDGKTIHTFVKIEGELTYSSVPNPYN